MPALLRVLEDEALAQEEAPGEGWAPIHAAALLGELRQPEALEGMLRQLLRTEPETVLHERLLVGLQRFGPPVFEPAWRLLEEAQDRDARESLLSILSSAGVRDERLLRELLALLEKERSVGAIFLARYGDPAAIPALEAALRAEVDTPVTGLFGGGDLGELSRALRTLGGAVPPAVQEHLDGVTSLRKDAALELLRAAQKQALTEARQPKPGRNDPCPCGSGKKFKKCHGA